MRRGYFRLGVLLTCIWLALVLALVIQQYFSANPFCQFDASTIWEPTCQSLFWSWVPSGKLATLSPHVARMLLLGLLPPAVAWALGVAVGWVIRGFRANAT